MFNKSIQRWNWINAFLTASLHASISGAEQQVNPFFSFGDFLNGYSKRVNDRLQVITNDDIPLNITFEEEELAYIFHLESELWGVDWKKYVNFFSDNSTSCVLLRTFDFVLSFFVIERALSLFIPNNLSRKQNRQYLFGYQDGLFSVKYPRLLKIMGAPFYLYANTSKTFPLQDCHVHWSRVKLTPISTEIESFYISNTTYKHFSKIIEAAFINTRKTHLTSQLSREKKKKTKVLKNVKAWWYDVLWNYSESIRYHPVLPSEKSLENPFYWNRSVRWFTSLTLTGLLLILNRCNSKVNQVWSSCVQKNEVLQRVFDGVDRFQTSQSLALF